MGFTLNTSILRTPTGILKILEIVWPVCVIDSLVIVLLQVLVLIVLMICRFGNDGHRKTWGSDDDDFLGQGTTVGYAIIVPAVLITYLLGANLSILELFINLVGGILFIAVGALAISYYQHQRCKIYYCYILTVFIIIIFRCWSRHWYRYGCPRYHHWDCLPHWLHLCHQEYKI